MADIPARIFKAYDIRSIAIGRDGRLSSPALSEALARGLRKSGIAVIDLGRVTTPMTYFAAFQLRTGCTVMVIGSHNPPDHNGLKVMLAGEALSGEAIQRLRTRIETGDLTHGSGSYSQYDIAPEYLARIIGDIRLARPLRITVDCSNGVAGDFAAKLYRGIGCEVSGIFCEVDGHFPNHHPDPSDPRNLQDLIAALTGHGSELGLAFDGDADRLGIVTRDGKIIYPDRKLMLFAADLLARHPGAAIVFDVKSTRKLFPWIRMRSGRPILWKTGHLFFKERWHGFDDGLYAGARLQQQAVFEGAEEIIPLDGLRVEYADGFGLVRASNTTASLVLRFEADDDPALVRIQEDFRKVLRT